MTIPKPRGSQTRLSSELDDREPRYDVADKQLSGLIDDFLKQLPAYDHTDLLREILVTVVKLAEQNTQRGDLKILRSAAKELRYAYKVFDNYRDVPKVTIFGSARSQPETPAYQVAKEFASRMVERGYMVITGAGGGIMEAGNEGAGPDHSFGLNILLPFEQQANPHIVGDPKLINFRYFFTRKLFFIKESDAVVLLPGGFGTQDEGFEALTLIQTGKDKPTPIVMLDSPGGGYWQTWLEFVREDLLTTGLISKEDRALFKVTENIEEACDEIAHFYHRYHSSRYVDRRKRLMIRLRTPLSEESIEQLSDEFQDILTGPIESCSPAAEEDTDEPDLKDLPRLSVPFTQHHFGRLRLLIDAINDYPEARSPK